MITNESVDDFLNENIVNNIRFTPREIDILACLLHARSTKKIAFLLSIDPKTVRNHLHNIMVKLGCNSRDAIVDFLESSSKIEALKNYYSTLIMRASFEEAMKKISLLIKRAPISCRFIYWRENAQNFAILHLEKHLKQAGLSITLDERANSQSLAEFMGEARDESSIICMIPHSWLGQIDMSEEDKIFKVPHNASQNNIIFLAPVIDNEIHGINAFNKCSKIKIINYLDFFQRGIDYCAIFDIIRILFPKLNFDKIFSDFKIQHVVSEKSASNASFQHFAGTKELEQNKSNFKFTLYPLLKQKNLFLILIFLFLAICGKILVQVPQARQQKERVQIEEPIKQITHLVRSDLIIPLGSAFLDRPELITKIEDTFIGDKGIQSTALVGIGGAGKTIIARQYAQEQKENIIWEMNAETRESLKNSFERLAQNLSKREKDKRELKEIQEIKDSRAREEKLVEFVKSHLKLRSNWFLIYDNVEKLTDIQKYFPLDPQIWGQGKVLLTSRNTNIQNNGQIGHVLSVGELSQKQKLELFMKIMNRGSSQILTATQSSEAKKFLEHIPSFPLDISVAAYYLKSTNISYDDYLENLTKYTHEFANLQQSLLKEAGSYLNTRYGIITLSLEQLLKEHKDFTDLLLFIGMLGSQNIPRNLLSQHKNNIIIDNFIYHLNKYSLLTNNIADSASNLTFSIHRSTQDIILSHMSKKLNLIDDKKLKNKKIVQNIQDTLVNYIADSIERGNFTDMKFLTLHCTSWLSHKHFLTDQMQAFISGELGGIYCHQGLYEKAKGLIEASLAKLDKEKNPIGYAHVSIYLGKFYIALGDYEKAKTLFEDNLALYNKHSIFPRDLLKTLTYLGTICRKIGDYKKAQEHLEKCFTLYKSHFPENAVLIPWTSISLANLYLDQGKYEKARILFENTLKIYQKDFPENHIAAAEIFQRLGVIQRDYGHYSKAISLLENSIKSYRQDLSKNHIYVAQPLAYLGSVYIETGDYPRAQKILEKSLYIYHRHIAKNNVLAALALGYLGNLYKHLRDYKLAKDYLQQNLSIYENKYGKHHIKTAGVLRDLGRVYLLENNTQTAENFLKLALEIFGKSNHPESYTYLESLADLYRKQHDQAEAKMFVKEAQNFHNQSLQNFNRALEIVNAHFPEDSPHKARIRREIKKIDEGAR